MNADEPMLRLYSSDLLSKWGFNDGDMPDELRDYFDSAGEAYPQDWHVVLRRLVRDYLLSQIDADVEVYDIYTSHNPIRASRVNGVEVDNRALDAPVVLTPEYVDIPYSTVLAVARGEQ